MSWFTCPRCESPRVTEESKYNKFWTVTVLTFVGSVLGLTAATTLGVILMVILFFSAALSKKRMFSCKDCDYSWEILKD